MRRSNFFKITTVDDIEELDFLYNNISEFQTTYPVSYYRVTDSDVPDPALISYKVYGSTEFFWILLIVNGIENAFTELVPGLILTIPHKLDIYKYQKKFKIRR